MRLHRFYTTESIGADPRITIHSADLVHQIRRVFRMTPGDSVILFNGTGFDYECKIDNFGERNTIDSDNIIRLHVTTTKRSRIASQQKIFLCASVVKKDTFEWVVEKASELGVTDIIPVISARSEKKSLNTSRLKKIAIEASEQSGRGTVPMVHTIMGVEDAAMFLQREEGNAGIQLIAFHTEGERFRAGQISKGESVGVFIGPEGGWTDEEVDMFHSHDIAVRSLGDQVLRSETAVVSTLSLLVFGR